MAKTEYYYILAFETTTDALHAEACAKNNIKSTLMPVPREISSGCGLALRFMEEDDEAIFVFCRNTPLNGTLYKMKTEKVDGRHPIQKIDLS